MCLATVQMMLKPAAGMTDAFSREIVAEVDYLIKISED